MHTDANCEPSGDSFRVVCCWWLVTGEVRTGGVLTLPAEVITTFGNRKTLIAQGEAFAPLLALWFHGEHVVNTDILLFVDNQGVVSMLCGGSLSNLGIGGIIHTTNFLLARRKTSLWTEHVQSTSSCLDGGSREEGVACHMAAKCGVALHTFEFPSRWPVDMQRLDASLWLGFLSSAEMDSAAGP